MKGTFKRAAALIMSFMVILSMFTIPAFADETAPTAVSYIDVTGYPEYISLGFENDAYLNSITEVTVNDTVYSKGTIASFTASGDTVWDTGSVSGGYGSYNALKIITKSISYPASIRIKASGYNEITVKVTKSGYSNYTASVESTSSPEPSPEPTTVPTVAPTVEPTVEPTVTPSDEKEPPSVISECRSNMGSDFIITLEAASDWLNAISSVKVNDVDFEKTSSQYDIFRNQKYSVKADNNRLYLGEGFDGNTAVCVINAAGYKPLTIKVDKSAYTAEIVKEGTEEPKPEETKKIDLKNVKIEKESFGSGWNLKFSDSDGYVSAVTSVSVNDETWEQVSYGPYYGGAYKKNTDGNYIVFSSVDNSGDQSKPVLKSGDVVKISAAGYEELEFKFVIDKDGNVSVKENDGEGDPYELKVKIDGTFEAAIVGQKDYDGVSSASTGGASSNKNSAVKVYGALVEKGTEPSDSDWKELDHQSDISLNGSKCSVSIVPDTANGTADTADSGMSGVYMTLSSDLTLNGTPKDAGSYLVSVSIEDSQGRKAVSNSLPFVIYSGEETLADRIKVENLNQYANGLYAWDIMEPWAIKNFGSNVDGEEESVRVPKDLEVWFGSHESGTYGYLGYDIPWSQVKSGDIPQTLYIPAGCNLTLTNMKILSSVRIVVESGGKLTLSDSTVQGIIDVKNGGTFSMNYDAYAGNFTTGASICGQLILEAGANLENAAIYSHTNYLANGNLTDRTNSDPVVVANGNVNITGQVFIHGDEAGSDGKGQAALLVKGGKLTLSDGSVLAAYGGGGTTTLYSKGGDAIQLDNGSITGNGKVIAVGGAVLFGPGGDAVTGSGSIDSTQAFVQGATSYTAKNAEPGKAVSGDVLINSSSRHVEDGTQIESGQNDPLANLYWKPGIQAAPNLDNYTVKKAYTISIAADIKGGTVVSDKASATAGEEVTLTATPDEHYSIDAVNVTVDEENNGRSAQTVDVTDKGNGIYVFEMPDSPVVVNAAFTHTHEADTSKWEYDEDNHWNPCTDPNCTEHLNKAAHSFEWVIDKEPTVSETGLKHEVCSVCGKTRSEGTVIDKLPKNSNDNGNNKTDQTDKDKTDNTSGNKNTSVDNRQTAKSKAAGKTNSITAPTKAPKTGNETYMPVFIALIIAAGAGCTATVVASRKRRG